MTKKQAKEVERRIDMAYRKTCRGIQINMMDIPKVFKFGRQLIEGGVDEATLEGKIHEYVLTIAVGKSDVPNFPAKCVS